jgi:hypothetical protein
MNASYDGKWFTTFGPMTLTQADGRVTGVYQYGPIEGRVRGECRDNDLQFRFEEPNHTGVGWFHQSRANRIQGRWHNDGSTQWSRWVGSRGFDGLWQFGFGRMRIHEDDRSLHAWYELGGPASLQGVREGDRFVYRFHEPHAHGEGWFLLDDDGMSLRGAYLGDGESLWKTWRGRRILPASRPACLLVLEAHWQGSLDEREYSFGRMLGEFFARLDVNVRHRFFQYEDSLLGWCRELLYIEEPTIVTIACHGTSDGPRSATGVIPTRRIVETLIPADCVQLLHFSSCNILHEQTPGDLARRLPERIPFPISGYTEVADWSGSAIFEMNYFDLILNKHLFPDEAARQVQRLIRYSSSQQVPDCAYPPLGFRFLPPRQGNAISSEST